MPPGGPLARAEARLAASRPLVLGLLIAVSVALRIVYLAQAAGTPILDQHRSKASDMHFFDLWAQRVASGDLLVDEPFHPFQRWHDDLARQHFAAHLEQRDALLAAWRGPVDATTASRLLWQRWYGGRRFHQEPLYPYLLGASYALFGVDVRPMLWLQMAAGVLGNVLVWLVARRCFGDLVGGLAGALAVLCGPLLYYEAILLRDSLVAVAGIGLVLLVQRAEERSSVVRFAVLGLVAGVALLLKSSLGLFYAAALAGLAWRRRGDARRSLALQLGAALTATALALSPAIARNLAVGAPALGLSSVGAITFACANAEDYGREPGFAGEFGVSRHAAAIMARSEGAFGPAVAATLATHDGAGSLLRQTVSKLGVLLWWYEVPNNASFDYYRLHAPILGALPVTFLWIGPLGLVGLALARPRAAERPIHGSIWPLHALLAAGLVVALAFGVFARLRLPLVAPLLPFAALAIVTGVRWGIERRAGALVALLGATAALAAVTARPLPDGRPRIRPTDYTTPFVTHTKPRVTAALARGAPCDAAAAFADLLATEPAAVRALDGRAPVASAHDEVLARFFRRIHDEHAASLDSCRNRAADPATRSEAEARRARALSRVAELDASLALGPAPR